jgi:hypothetical protein
MALNGKHQAPADLSFAKKTAVLIEYRVGRAPQAKSMFYKRENILVVPGFEPRKV